ncbi:MAG TPA: hypothetical protein PLO24_12650 [Bacteroidales bacterium]|nr:hypothetical protein [Bacteroidales bacterium]HOS71672.1 hypothetical protein [Bacteroidales bacterium]HQH23608.1 hypothetical protein [Bacteroidales bacterium]HQJ81130.1 hypothetical protein [Bacteroidales bacterium]
MDLISTQFVKYQEIKTRDIDLHEDAFGLYQQFDDVIGYLNMLKPEPPKNLTRRLITRIRKH